MQKIIVLIGCCGCGKDTVAKYLMSAFAHLNFEMVSTSKILGGGNTDGSLISNDLMIHLTLEQYLEQIGFFDKKSSDKFYVFNGAGRNRIQMSSLIGMLTENRMLTENAKFVKLNITSQEAYRRMKTRYHENLKNNNLRKEEVGDYDVVLKRFRSRIAEWQKTRDGIYESMVLNLKGHKSPIIDMNGGRELPEVCFDLVKQIGLPVGPMIDTLRNAGLVPQHSELLVPQHSELPVSHVEKGGNSLDYTRVMVQ